MMKCFDIQVNGAFGCDFSEPGLTCDDFRKTAKAILDTGVTRFLPTIITSSDEVYRKNLSVINQVIDEDGLQYEIPGFHLEGPFISDKPGAVGAHNPAWVQMPTPERLDRLNEYANGRIRIMTFAAENPGVKETIVHAHELGITASIGHQLANSEQMAAAGADCLTHLGNGIPNMIDRHRNPIWSGLANDDLTALLITDGHHLPPEVLKCMLRCKTPARVVAISDASPAAGLPPGRYHVLGNDAVLYENGLLINEQKKCLVGSSFLMPRCIKLLQTLGYLTEEEIKMVVWDNPHKLLKLSPEKA